LEPRDRDVARRPPQPAAVGQLAAAPGVKRALLQHDGAGPRVDHAGVQRQDVGVIVAEVARHDDQTREGEYAVATSTRSSIAPTRSPCFALVTRLISFHSASAMNLAHAAFFVASFGHARRYTNSVRRSVRASHMATI